MLIEFRVENHRSIRDEQVLSMVAAPIEGGADPRARKVAGSEDALLPVAALYGANASGKSNFLYALDFMRETVLFSHRSWSPTDGIPRNPFAWEPKRTEPSEYVVLAILDDVKYEYGFVADDVRFLEEWLYAWPKGRQQKWFERDGDQFSFGDHFAGENKTIEAITRPNSLFLSAAIQNKHEQISVIHNWFSILKPLNMLNGPLLRRAIWDPYLLLRLVDEEPTNALVELENAKTERFKTLLRNADVGITDMRVRREKTFLNGKKPIIEFKHGTHPHWLPLHEESKGTQTLFRFGSQCLEVIEKGGTIIVDELESSLHPMLAAQIVRQFNDPKTNPKNAQLIFTTHDTNLLGTTLGEPLLRRDQIWFTEKDKEGATVLYPLTDYKPRKEENLERGYLQGRYGAIPFLGQLHLGAEGSA